MPLRSGEERGRVPGRRIMGIWVTFISSTVLWYSSYASLDEKIENPQRMWDPQKGNILGQNGMMEVGLENVTVTNQTAQIGTTAYLHCYVRNMADRQVSWIRRRDYHILTSGFLTYSQDQRFGVVRPGDANDWALQIKFVQERDEGPYECQVSTKTGRYGYLVNLKVVIPEAVISGLPDIHVESGSTISLLCIIEGSITPPQFILWFHNNKMINYDQSRGTTTVTTEDRDFASSRLTINNASFRDSGVYNCTASNTKPTSVNVYVSEGDKTAAIQRLGSTGGASDPFHNKGISYIWTLVTLQIAITIRTYFLMEVT